MLIAKGLSPRFFLTDGRVRRGPSLLHDESGRMWPSSSGLVMRFPRASAEPCDDAAAQKYFGETYDVRCSRPFPLPPKDLSEWKRVGEVRRAEYRRGGVSYPGEYEHDFGTDDGKSVWQRFASTLRGHALPELYERDGILRLELAPGSEWSWRGLIG